METPLVMLCTHVATNVERATEERYRVDHCGVTLGPNPLRFLHAAFLVTRGIPPWFSIQTPFRGDYMRQFNVSWK